MQSAGKLSRHTAVNIFAHLVANLSKMTYQCLFLFLIDRLFHANLACIVMYSLITMYSVSIILEMDLN